MKLNETENNAIIDNNTSYIKDGYSIYNDRISIFYNELKAEKPPKDIYQKQPPKSSRNPYDVELTIGEIITIEKLKKLGFKVQLILDDKSRPTKDFKALGIKWELKTPTTSGKMTIRNIINKATDQNKSFIMLDVSYLDKDMSWIFDKINTHLSIKKNSKKVKGLVVIRGNKIIRYK